MNEAAAAIVSVIKISGSRGLEIDCYEELISVKAPSLMFSGEEAYSSTFFLLSAPQKKMKDETFMQLSEKIWTISKRGSVSPVFSP